MAPGHRRRVMERLFNYGIDNMNEREFLEMCLFCVYKRRDTNLLARNLLEKFGKLENVCNAPENKLCEVEGVGKAAAEFLRALPHISRGYSLHTTLKRGEVYEYKSDIEKRCVALLEYSTNEKAFLLCFDRRKRLIKEAELSEGEPGGVEISVRKVMDAIANTATDSVVLCHNHPSGILKPSSEDVRATNDITEFLKTLNIELIDHLIVFRDKFVSCVSVEK